MHWRATLLVKYCMSHIHLPNVLVVVSEGDSLYTSDDRDTTSSIGGHDIIQLSSVITARSSSQPYN